MKALITGASGFIGSTLASELTSMGFEVFALLRSSSNLVNLDGIPYSRIEGSLSDQASLVKAVKGMDYVFHLAGATAAPSREAFFEVNSKGTENLIRTVAQHQPNLKKFVLVSSLAASGPAISLEQAKKETDLDSPVSFYGESKLQGEKETLIYRDRIPISIVRPPMVYGPKDKGVFIFIETVARNIVPIFKGKGPGNQKYYSAIHVKDLVRGISQIALKQDPTSGEKYYLSADEVFSYEQLISTIAEILDRSPLKLRVPVSGLTPFAAVLTAVSKLTGRTFALNLDKMNEIRPDFWICSNQKAKEDFGFSAEFNLMSGMKNTIEWCKEFKWI